jgi:hypothetical protein
MKRFSLPLTRLVHENLSIVMSFAYSRQALRKMVTRKFSGTWKYLHKFVFEIPEQRAEKARLELALFLRMVDDEEGVSAYDTEVRNVLNCSTLFIKKNSKTFRDSSKIDLSFRDFANKVIHSSRLEWKFPKNAQPKLICHPRDKEKWLRAEVDLVALSAVCARLMS